MLYNFHAGLIAEHAGDAAAAEQVLGQVRERYPDYESFGAPGPSPGAQAAQ